jgi:hypothetical protein
MLCAPKPRSVSGGASCSKTGEHESTSDEGPPARIEIDHFLLMRLLAEAARRDMPVNSLIRDLLDAIVAEGHSKPREDRRGRD